MLFWTPPTAGSASWRAPSRSWCRPDRTGTKIWLAIGARALTLTAAPRGEAADETGAGLPSGGRQRPGDHPLAGRPHPVGAVSRPDAGAAAAAGGGALAARVRRRSHRLRAAG